MEELLQSYGDASDEENSISRKRKESLDVVEEKAKKKALLPPLPKEWFEGDSSNNLMERQ